MEVSDRVTVLRKGRYVGTVDTAATTQEELSRMMVGPPPCSWWWRRTRPGLRSPY